ncbi:APC family permease [Rhodococcus sp. JVH1]|uniref:APC family permease n=1 Tax=Rhodococcus sp. JVH1 TaxID=745408 RepID=UPI000271FEF3|nr:APC family permease [Rhodococcus sp. JVH1]EJI93331.1 amino acid permease family protein [Rhodococcus sp. JVH1]
MIDKPTSAVTGEIELPGLDEGHLSRTQIISLALASFIPAVAIASFPVLLVATAGNGSWLASLISAVATTCVGVAVITFAKRFVATGSLYSYIAEVFGPWARYLMAATLFLGYLAQILSMLLIIGLYSGSFLLSVGVDSGLDHGTQILIYVVSAIVVIAVTCRGLDTSVVVAVSLTVLSLPLMLLITGASAIHTGLHLGEQLSLQGSTTSGIIAGIAIGAAFVVGLESCAALAAETKDPKRNVPAAVMSVPVILGVAYLAATFLQIPGLMQASANIEAGMSGPAALAQQSGLGEGIGQASDLVLAIATFASLIGFANYGSRFAATLAADGLLSIRFAQVHRRLHSPVNAILLTVGVGLVGLVTMVALDLGSPLTIYSAVATLVAYFWVIPYVLICAGAVRLVAREKKLGAGLVTACTVGALTMAWLLVSAIINPPPAPIDAMTYVFVVATLVLSAAFAVAGRRRTQDSVKSTETRPVTPDPVA